MHILRVAILGQGRSGRDIHGAHLSKDLEHYRVPPPLRRKIRSMIEVSLRNPSVPDNCHAQRMPPLAA